MFAGNAKWGPTEKCLEVRRPGEIFIHQPAQTHMMVVPGDTMINFSLDNFFTQLENEFMLAAYAWIEDGLDGRLEIIMN